MKIVHIAPNSPYNDYWGYQDNLLPKYQKKLGHDITVIITNTEHRDGKIVEVECSDYVLNDGEKIIRRKHKKMFVRKLTNVLAYIPIYKILCDIKPDFIFYHGLVSNTIFDVIKYKKRHKCVIVQDNHMDYNIGYSNSLKHKLLGIYYRMVNKYSIKYVQRVYGVTPWRKTYAEEYFGIPCDKTDVLIMGADDEKIDFKNRNEIRETIRKKLGFNNDFVIVTGGKIDKKKRIVELMKACSAKDKVKLLVFGSVSNDVKAEFDKLLTESSNIIYIGWINSDDVYNYFFASDLAFFPGQHSVLWEQACASKIPCVFEKWEGMDHVNNGGNSDFVSNVDVSTLSDKIDKLIYTKKYYDMKKVAESDATDVYLYSKIAKKSLECVQDSIIDY